MLSPRHGQFSPGEIVYARWHGEDEFQIVEEIFGAMLPHYKCKVFVMAKYEYWIFPQIHLSRKELGSLTREANRKQLTLAES